MWDKGESGVLAGIAFGSHPGDGRCGGDAPPMPSASLVDIAGSEVIRTTGPSDYCDRGEMSMATWRLATPCTANGCLSWPG